MSSCAPGILRTGRWVLCGPNRSSDIHFIRTRRGLENGKRQTEGAMYHAHILALCVRYDTNLASVQGTFPNTRAGPFTARSRLTSAAALRSLPARGPAIVTSRFVLAHPYIASSPSDVHCSTRYHARAIIVIIYITRVLHVQVYTAASRTRFCGKIYAYIICTRLRVYAVLQHRCSCIMRANILYVYTSYCIVRRRSLCVHIIIF